MALDIRNLSPTQLVRLLNSTPLGTVINAGVRLCVTAKGARDVREGCPFGGW